MKRTQKSLLLSGLSLLICATMLIGATFAWFTDSVVNTGNIIKAGNLSVDAFVYELDMDNTGTTQYQIDGVNGGKAFYFATVGQSLKDENCPPIIDEQLWEPGKSSAKLLEVKNGGSLAAKIKLRFDVKSSGLMNALWFDFIQVDSNGNITGTFIKRPMNTLETFAKDMEISLANNGQTVRFILVYGMYEEANNDYMNKSFRSDVTILATQDTVEKDGFGSEKYDAGATYPVADSDELAEVINQAVSGDTILLSPGSFTLPDETKIPEGVTLTGNGIGETKITVPETNSGGKTMGLVIDQPGVTISNASILPNFNIENDNFAGVVVVKEGGTVLDNVSITSYSGASPVLVTGSSFGQDDTLTISNSTLTSNARSLYIVDGTNGKVVIDNCEITGIYTFNVNSSNSQNLEIEVCDSKLHGWTSYGFIKSASFVNTEFSKGNSSYNFLRPYADTTWDKCTFKSDFKIGAGAADLTYIFNGCNYDGVAVTAENIEDKLLDPTGDDVKVLDCTLIVDGTTVLFS